MKVYKDVFSGDEMVSDAFPLKELHNGCILEIEAKMVKEGGESFDIGANPSSEEAAEDLDDGAKIVNNVISAFHLEETPFTKKDFMSYIKGYMKKVKEHLEKNKPDRVQAFMKDIQPWVKEVLGRFDDFQFYTGESMDPEAGVALLFYKEDGVTPYFYFILDGLKEEKL